LDDDGGSEGLVFTLPTSKFIPRYRSSAPLLPNGTLLGGLAAAIMQHCELRGVPACAAISVQAGPVPDAQLVCGLADIVLGLIKGKGGDAGEVKALNVTLTAVVEDVYRSSASNSIFI
jgi:hypothetical protein